MSGSQEDGMVDCEEGRPLLQKQREEQRQDSKLSKLSTDRSNRLKGFEADSYTFCEKSGRLKRSRHELEPHEHQDLEDHGVADGMMYSTKNLTTWAAFNLSCKTVWLKSELWIMMLKLFFVALATCICTVLAVPDPAVFKVAKFTSISKFLNVVVGLLLGFFLSSSMNRWHGCVSGFMELLDAVRNMQIQFLALGVPDQDIVLVLRYGCASAWLLFAQLIVEAKALTGSETTERELMWEKLSQKPATIDKSGNTPLLTEKEIQVLKTTHDPPYIVWTWVGVILGSLSQDGWIPAMNSPTYGRIMNICQSAHAGIREIRTAITVQAPLIYCQLLATLVHINNLLNAITFGIVSGLAIGTALIAHDVHIGAAHYFKHDAKFAESKQDWQNMIVTFIYSFFGPLLYQALLLISMYLAQPFQSEDAAIPIDRLLHQLEIDMCNSRDAVGCMDFKMPYFKKPDPKDKRRNSTCHTREPTDIVEGIKDEDGE